MAAFIVLINGRQVCSVSLAANDSCSVHLAWIGGGTEPLLLSHVGGVMGGERVQWDLPQLKLGDEVTIKIAASGGTDSPSLRQPYARLDRSVGCQRPGESG